MQGAPSPGPGRVGHARRTFSRVKRRALLTCEQHHIKNRRGRTPRRGVIELFCGAGGFGWGWREAGFSRIASIDHDPVAARTCELNLGVDHGLILNRDLDAFGPAKLAKLIGTRPGGLAAIVGGPPCQGWSKVGRGKMRSLDQRARNLLRDPRNGLYRRFLEYVSYFRPPLCVMENVPGMLSIEGENIADAILANFRSIGYRATVAVVNARWFGVPQDRKRLIFLAVRDGFGPGVDAAALEDFAIGFRMGLLDLSDETNVWQAIADLPAILHGTVEDPQPYSVRSGRGSRYSEIMRARSNGLVLDHVCRGHNAQDLEAFALMREGGLYHQLPARLKRYRDDIFRDKYKKLVRKKPAWTVTAHFEKDVYTHIHPTQPRTISVREAARLQSFPDDFRFAGHMGDRFRQIGNAVPPLMAWGIAEFVRGYLEFRARP